MTTHAEAPPSSPDARPGLSWEEICRDPRFQDLPYTIETNARGQILMSPTYQYHGALQAEIAGRLREEKGGRTVTESAIETDDGIKVADVAWYSAPRWSEVKTSLAAPVAPEIAVEILSPGNTSEELQDKRTLYFAAGAEEVWVCDREGALRFFTPDGEQEASPRCPEFPTDLDL